MWRGLFRNVEELRQALLGWTVDGNRSWLIERHGSLLLDDNDTSPP
jgi:hypothetical protein